MRCHRQHRIESWQNGKSHTGTADIIAIKARQREAEIPNDAV